MKGRQIKLLVVCGSLFLLALSVLAEQYNLPDFISILSRNDSHKTAYNERILPLPQFDVEGVFTESISVNSLQPKVLLINFWASWCASCIEEFPAMLDLTSQLDGKIAVLAISIDDKKENALSFLTDELDSVYENARDVKNFHWAWDSNKHLSLGLFNTFLVPETIIVDPNGLMIDKVVGIADWSGSEMKQKLLSLYTQDTL